MCLTFPLFMNIGEKQPCECATLIARHNTPFELFNRHYLSFSRPSVYIPCSSPSAIKGKVMWLWASHIYCVRTGLSLLSTVSVSMEICLATKGSSRLDHVIVKHNYCCSMTVDIYSFVHNIYIISLSSHLWSDIYVLLHL